MYIAEAGQNKGVCTGEHKTVGKAGNLCFSRMWSDIGQIRCATEIRLMEHHLNVGIRGTWHRPGLSLPLS
jgi:hypothetical protein